LNGPGVIKTMAEKIIAKLKRVVGNRERVCGELIVAKEPISFLGDAVPEEGIIRGLGSVVGKIVVYPAAIGSTVSSYKIYGFSYYGKAPAAFVAEKNVDPVTLIGCVLGNIPLYEIKEVIELPDLARANGRRACISGNFLILLE